MSRTTVTFNGTDLTQSFVVSNLRRPLLPRTIGTSSVPGHDGSIFTGVTLAQSVITMTLTVRGSTLAARETAARTLASLLAVSEPKALAISTDGGKYYLAIPNSANDGIIARNALRYDVAFTVPDPVLYGTEQTVTVPSGGSVTFTVAGTYPTMPTITASSAKKNSTLGYWKLQLEDGTYLIASTPGSSAVPLSADCGARILRVNSSLQLLQPEADWLVFTPGQHTLTMTGTGAATVKYRERWV